MLDRSVAPEIKNFGDISLPVPENTRLSNGVELLVLDCATEDVVRLDLIFNGGLFEQDKIMSCRMMLSMLKQGTKDFDAACIAERLDFCGAWLQTRTYDHHTVITVYSINRCLGNVLEIIEQMVKYPVFPEHEFNVLKKQAISELRNNRQRVKYIATSQFNKKFFGKDHPLGRPNSISSLKGLSTDDLKDLHSRYLTKDGLRIMLTGKINAETLSLVDKYFGKEWGSGKHSVKLNSPVISPSKGRLFISHKSGSLQSCVVMGIPAIERGHEDYIPLRILVIVLGGYFGSRLMTNIREEKGYTYGISASLIGRPDSAYIFISSESDTKYTGPLIREVKKEIDKLVKHQIGEEELEIVKSNILSDLVKTVDSPFSIAEFHITAICCGIPDDYFEKHIELIKNISPEKLRQTAEKYFVQDNLFILVAGDKNKLKKYVDKVIIFYEICPQIMNLL